MGEIETNGVSLTPTMQTGNCFKCPKSISAKMNLESQSFQEKYIKSENSKKQSGSAGLPYATAKGPTFARFMPLQPKSQIRFHSFSKTNPTFGANVK
jgi:hypothetical protein